MNEYCDINRQMDGWIDRYRFDFKKGGELVNECAHLLIDRWMNGQIYRYAQIDIHLKKGGIWELVNEYCSIKR